jgi:hypothetical protein
MKRLLRFCENAEIVAIRLVAVVVLMRVLWLVVRVDWSR